MKEGQAPQPQALGSVPRISRLMTLALRMQALVGRGEVAEYADLARLAHVSRARITQIVNLLLLAPDIQKAILFLPRTDGPRKSVHERTVRRTCAVPDSRKEQRMWDHMLGSRARRCGL